LSSLISIVIDNKLYIANAGGSKPLLLKEKSDKTYNHKTFNFSGNKPGRANGMNLEAEEETTVKEIDQTE
jgi:hypothetical protein